MTFYLITIYFGFGIAGREPPSVEIYPKDRQVIEKGASALFQCILTAGIPSPQVTWARSDGRPLSPNAESLKGGVLRY